VLPATFDNFVPQELLLIGQQTGATCILCFERVLKGAAMAHRPDVLGEEMHQPLADADTAERFITDKHLGERIRRLRLKKSMGLVELGRNTGLSASFLSQLETGRVVPTLRNLARIAMVFSKDLSYFFESEPAAMFRVHRRKDRVRMPQTGVDPPTYTFESLGYMVPDRQMDPYFAEFFPLPPNVEPNAHMHAGFEVLYVIEGELMLRHGDQEASLGPGDSVYFDAGTPHSYRCAGGRPAEAIIVTMHQTPGGHPIPLRPQAPAAPRPAPAVAAKATAADTTNGGRT
jgi:transcriptional regulator with XRE-family HTH domain